MRPRSLQVQPLPIAAEPAHAYNMVPRYRGGALGDVPGRSPS